MAGRLLINIDVPDLPAGIAFYEAGLGFRLRRRLFAGAVAELERDGARVFLIRAAPGSEAVPDRPARRDYADHWTPVHLDLVVEDLDAAIGRAIAAGAAPARPASAHAWGRLAPLRDPFGHGFCLVAFAGAGYDLVADG